MCVVCVVVVFIQLAPLHQFKSSLEVSFFRLQKQFGSFIFSSPKQNLQNLFFLVI